MNTIQTLTDFLRSTDASFRIFDLGRRISKLPQETFEKFEQTQIPYPLPFLQQAWLAVLIFDPQQPQQHLIWFLKFPLDEQGLLVLAARDDFLNRLAKTVGNQLLSKDGEEDPLKDNPFSFTPDQEKMAAFHARATRILKQPASGYYQPAREYFAGVKGYDHWDQLGLQGIADLAARLDQQDNSRLLADAVAKLPVPPLEALCVNLEHDTPPHPLSRAIVERIPPLLADANTSANTLGALIRGLSQTHDAQLRQQALTTLLNSRFGAEIEVLAAIASRCWTDLKQAELRRLFLDRLAVNSAGQQSFNLMIRDLVFMPGMRDPIMASFRDPERSEDLSKAIGAFFGG